MAFVAVVVVVSMVEEEEEEDVETNIHSKQTQTPRLEIVMSEFPRAVRAVVFSTGVVVLMSWAWWRNQYFTQPGKSPAVSAGSKCTRRVVWAPVEVTNDPAASGC